MEGPKMSVSKMPARWPCRANANARLAASVDLPTPPFAEKTAITFRTFGMRRFVGRPRCMRGIVGGAPLRGRPYCHVRKQVEADIKEDLPEGFHDAGRARW